MFVHRTLTAALLSILLGVVLDVSLGRAARVNLSDTSPIQGSVVQLTVSDTVCRPELFWRSKAIPLSKRDDRFVGYLPVGLEQERGSYPLTVHETCPDSSSSKQISILVEPGDYPVQRLTVEDTGKVQLSDEDLARHRRESRLINKALNHQIDSRLWEPPFHPPVNRDQFGPNNSFGSRRIINGQTRSPHSGEDYDAEIGDSVYAVNHGRVVLTGDFFFSGRGIFLDHGQGLTSMYFHLSEINISEGDTVRRGERIGLAGSTGRVTGPHLHLGIEWNGARVDPDQFFFGKTDFSTSQKP